MAKDAVATMGTILADDVGGRDAVHVAVIAVRAHRMLVPGSRVGAVMKDGEYVSADQDHVGIVDPFLQCNAERHDRFWLYLYPRTITGLAHHWTHPKFGDEGGTYATPASRLEAESWVRGYLKRIEGPSYEDIIRLVTEGNFYDEGKYFGLSIYEECLQVTGSDASGSIDSGLWDRLELITGKKIKHRPTYFTCSC